VLTAHDLLPREPRPGQRAAQRRLYARMDAIVVHTRHGRGRLVGELGVPSDRVRVIPHGAFDHLARLEGELPVELVDDGRPVVLFFGLLRPYKGLDVLLDAWRGVDGARLWIVGRPMMDVAELRARATGDVQWVPRFVDDREAAGLLRRADLVVLPYREAEASGVLHSAIALRRPVLLSAVGGFAEVAGARLVPPGDPEALREAIAAALADPPPPIDPAPYDWDAIARQHVALYEELA
jgi:glycosyltransferase involved in cell wall biosynthesis